MKGKTGKAKGTGVARKGVAPAKKFALGGNIRATRRLADGGVPESVGGGRPTPMPPMPSQAPTGLPPGLQGRPLPAGLASGPLPPGLARRMPVPAPTTTTTTAAKRNGGRIKRK